jgi:fructose-specific phosphotransferase system IIC component
LLLNIVVIFLVTFVVAAIVTYIWNLLRHDLNAVDWDTAFVLAITFGIALPLVDKLKKKDP